MSSSTTYQKARLSLAMLGINGLPFDEYLSELPPLPETPQHSRRIDDIPEGIVTTGISRHTTPIAPPLPERRREASSSSEDSHEEASSALLREPTLGRPGNIWARSPLSTQPAFSADQCGDATEEIQPLAPLAPSLANTTLQVLSTTHRPSSPSISCAVPPPRLSASFRIPAMGDASLIADCSLFGGAAGSAGDDSMEYELNELRPKDEAVPVEEEYGARKEPLAGLHMPAVHHLNQSTLLPSSPAKTAHLLASTNAISHADPPWNGNMSVMSTVSDDMCDTATFSHSSPTCQPSHRAHGIPRSGSGSLRGVPTSNSKRTFPASSSGSSLAVVGEEGEQVLGPEISALLPSSPQKASHALQDYEMIAQEKMLEEGPSMRLAPPSAKANHENLARFENASSMASTRTQKHRRRIVDDMGDVTMDVKDLMAKVGKPKRASGTEESFVDLLHTDDMLNGMDMTMMAGDETMVFPSSLRPTPLPVANCAYANPSDRSCQV
ncbi:hypothetical protein IAT38_004750 [Cryptococcus sp. DSM 104549]